ncbi:penicillin-binding transpeptidase domain-containing protein [Bacillus megaterium]|uniref:penicillin-binding transpeptidase domain-containing protein n=1 Tax=Priestia megaterium TaxID=1404 RepID=UPI001292EFB6|nr:penicillin-binding transpeptidase domain-containing protein [Priestia megaterium]MQR88572.1 penicillin-binding transpeptidase domain-containing protein [Priestia megaterium]
MRRIGWLFFTMAILLLITAGCSNDQQKAQDRFDKYVAMWNKEDFKGMYGYLSKDAKKTISEKDFVNRYKNIYAAIEADKLKVKASKIENLEIKDHKAVLPFEVNMNSVAGEISFKENAAVVQEKQRDTENWYINWKPNMIFKGLKQGEQVRVAAQSAVRGEIMDRSGKYLAQNGEAIQVGVVPQQFSKGGEQAIQQLSKTLALSEKSINQALSASWVKKNQFVPIKTVSQKDASNLENSLKKVEGIQQKKVNARVYPCEEACAHLVGYVAPVTAEYLKEHKDEGYNAQSKAGMIGLESLYEDKLRARDGVTIYTVDKDGNKKNEIAKVNPKDGESIQVTVDTNVQKSLYEQLKDEKGVATALQPKTGEILGLVSTPAFDPNSFSFGIDANTYQSLSTNPDKPLMNRFTKTYSPGSTFKLVTGALAVDEGVVNPNESVSISGKKWQKDKSWGDFYVTRVGSKPNVNLRDAYVTSDNIYFAQTALKLGLDKFNSGLKQFGFNQKMPVNYPFETSKIAGDQDIKDEGVLANSGYGQGKLQVNPLHLALMYTSIVNDGNIVKPILMNGDKSGIWEKQVISEETAQLIQKDLVDVIEDKNGTGHAAKIDGLTLAGKTGTAELKKTQGEKGQENGWFVAVDTKQKNLLVSMMVEGVEDKGGSHYVVPKVKNVFQQYNK